MSAKTNNANRNRGKNLERAIAKELGWSRVPYSGNSEAFGRGDVVDDLDPRHTSWVVEAKGRKRENYGLEAGWMEALYEHRLGRVGGNVRLRSVALALRLYGSSEIWLAIPSRQLEVFASKAKARPKVICRIFKPASIVVERTTLLKLDSGICDLQIADDRQYGQIGALPQPCPEWLQWWWPITLIRLDVFKAMNPTVSGR